MTLIATDEQQTAAAAHAQQYDGETSVATWPVRERRGRSRTTVREPDDRTLPQIDDEEVGEEDAQNRFQAPEGASVQVEHAQTDESSTTRRSELAREALEVLQAVIDTLGMVACATRIQQFKLALTRFYVELEGADAEADFLSVVALIESSLAGRTWKDHSEGHLAAVRDALKLGYEKPEITYDDYQKVRRAFRDAGLGTAPRLDLASVNTEDWENDNPAQAS